MEKRFTHVVTGCFTLLLIILSAYTTYAQTVTIRNLDAGPYGAGSNIAALLTVTDDAGKLSATNNSFDLYMSDASGSFAAEKKIGTFKGYYTGFVNGIIPPGTPAGTGYKLRVKTTQPLSISAPSNDFTIATGAGVAALAKSSMLSADYPDVFGTCFSKEDNSFVIENSSTAGATVTADFYNDMLQVYEQQGLNIDPSGTFNHAKVANYTILVKAVKNGNAGTKAYLLLNNTVNISLQSGQDNTICFKQNQSDTVTFSTSSALQTNYPGNLYTMTWGDGTTTDFTYFQIKSNNSLLKHVYYTNSCGAKNAQGQVTNRFLISFKVTPPYCPDQYKNLYADQAVLAPPKNVITGPDKACTGKEVIFSNASYAGQSTSPGAGSVSCENVNATYQWFVNNVAVTSATVKKAVPLKYTFTAPGTYYIRLRYTSQNNLACDPPPDAMDTICVIDPPKPDFEIAAARCIGQGAVTPTDKSVVMNNCNNTIKYKWTVTPATGVTYAGGTNANSTLPQFVFSQVGKYDIALQIDNGNCDAVTSPVHSILISDVPKAVLSPDFSVCGNNKTIIFDATDGSQSKTILTGTAAPTATTFAWTVTPVGSNLAPATFENGTTVNSQYPQIKFPSYGTYEIKVTHTNDCNTVTSDPQRITFLLAPSVNAGADIKLCQSDNTVALNATVSDTYVSAKWTTTGTGTFSDPGSKTAVYTLSAADKAAGEVKLTFTVTTNLPGECKNIPDEMILTINPVNTVNTVASKTICTDNPVNYIPGSTVANSTFTWAVMGASNASGYSASGTGTINDILSATSANANGSVTYRITPRANDCDGTPFDFTVTIRPKPLLTQPADKTICSGSAAAIALQSNVNDIQYTWTSSTSGDVTGASSQATPVTTAIINDILVNNGTTPVTVTYTIMPVSVTSDNGCGGTSKTVTITVQPTTPTANAGADITLCNQSTYQLQGNNPGTFAGHWSGPAGVTFADANKYNTTVNGLQAGQSYVLRWTITGSAPCGDQFDEVKITVNPPIAQNTISLDNQTTCEGQTVVITGSTPTGGSGTYNYQWETSADNSTWTAITNQTGKDLAVIIQQSGYYRRSVNSATCTDDKSNVIYITVQPGISNNIIAGAQTACMNTTAGELTGQTPTGGGGSYNYQWQSSTNGGANWANIPGATGISYTTPVLTATIKYRRLVSTLVCSGTQTNTSNIITVTVNPDAKAEFTWTKDADCVPFKLTAQSIKSVPYADRNGQYTWYANGVAIGTGETFPGYTIAVDGQSVEIKLEVTSKFGCQPDVYAHTFTTTKVVEASFTQNINKGCGSTTVQFTNTSAPLGGATYTWDFGNGQTSTKAQPDAVTFVAGTDGKDVTYTIKLTAQTSCSLREYTSTVTVKPAVPVALISPALNKTSGCVPFTATINNISPGNNSLYIYHVYNAITGAELPEYTQTVSTTTPQDFLFNTAGKYKIYVEAVSECNKALSPPITITVSQATLFAGLDTAPNQVRRGCAPFTAEFVNTSQGQGNISYVYDWADGNKTPASDTRNIAHTFTQPGEYNVVLYASNDCSINSPSQVVKIIVDAVPTPEFTSTNTESSTCYTCTTVRFNNATPDISGQQYTWNFGDAANATTANPNISNERNPLHTYDYNKGGTYNVTLTVKNANDCGATVTHTVTIIEPNTALYLPNAFTPGSSNTDLRTFTAKGSGMRTWHMRIFNNYGELLWETDKLDSRGAPTEGWDGTFKGTLVPQGVYVWQIDAEFINGQQWKGMTYNSSAPTRTGAIHLIR